MNLDSAKLLIKVAASAKKSVMLWGPPGLGKSDLVRQIAAEMKKQFVDVRLSLLNPVDLRGLPVPMSEGEGKAPSFTTWLPPQFLPREGTRGILFLDEINLAVPTVQAAAYQLILDRKLGEYILPDGWAIIAAGNRAQDRSAVFEMSSALKNRFIHITVEADFGCWQRWAVDNNVHPHVLGYLSYRSQHLLQMPDNPAQYAFPTPRSWTVLSEMIHHGMEVCREFVGGIIGDGYATEFENFHKMAGKLPSIKAIMEGQNPPLPSSKGDDSLLYLIITTLAYETRQVKGADEIIKAATNSISYLGNNKLSKEFIALFLTSCMASNLEAKVRGEVFKKCRQYLEPLRQLLGV